MKILIIEDEKLSSDDLVETIRELNEVSINAPVIFCTAYDEYAIRAFKANGIDYILKPFNTQTIARAFEKYERLREKFITGSPLGLLSTLLQVNPSIAGRSILVYHQDKIIPVKLEDIALFYIENEITRLITFKREAFLINRTLEELEQITSPGFYRINRQYLVNRTAVKNASQYFGRKLSLSLTIPFSDPVTVSKVKVADFLNWLSNH